MEELQVGDPPQVGPYVLVGRLGAGGMGQVFLGRSAGGRLVAVKVIRAELAGDPVFRVRFAREVAAARRVTGLFTAPVLDADPAASPPWLVSGFVNGPSLAEAVDDYGQLPVASVLALAAGLAEGLAAVHAAGVVHRDMKPSNVLLAPDGPRVIDFGISQAVDVAHLTRMVIGSPAFMSPEQAEGGVVGPASDIFSLGAVLVFAATGEGPFGTGAPTALLHRVVHGTPRLDQVPGPVRPLAERCLAKDPGQRPTARQFLAELTAAHPLAADLTDWLPTSILSAMASPRPAATGPRDEPDASQVPAAAAATPAASAAGRQRRRAVAVIAALAALGAIVTLIIAAPWKNPPPVLRPAGLTTDSSTISSAAFHWSGPPAGPPPDRYEIVQDGQVVGSVPGNITYYQDAGLAPGTSYQFQVIAIRSGKRSPPSPVLSITTVTPPVSAAILLGQWTVSNTTTSVTPPDSNISIGKVGATWTDNWSFVPDCAVSAGACNVTLKGTFDGSDFTSSLTRAGTIYTGTAELDKWEYCVNPSNSVNATLHLQVQVRGGDVTGSAWTATSWAGTLTLDLPYIPAGNCYADTFKISVGPG